MDPDWRDSGCSDSAQLQTRTNHACCQLQRHQQRAVEKPFARIGSKEQRQSFGNDGTITATPQNSSLGDHALGFAKTPRQADSRQGVIPAPPHCANTYSPCFFTLSDCRRQPSNQGAMHRPQWLVCAINLQEAVEQKALQGLTRGSLVRRSCRHIFEVSHIHYTRFILRKELQATVKVLPIRLPCM